MINQGEEAVVRVGVLNVERKVRWRQLEEVTNDKKEKILFKTV